MLTSLGLSDPTSQWGLFLGGPCPLGGAGSYPASSSTAWREEPGSVTESSRLAWVQDRAPACCLSVCISLRVTGLVVPAPLLTRKTPQLCLRCSALGSPGSDHMVSMGLRGSLHDVPPCPAASPARLPTHLARGAGAWPSCAPGAMRAPAHLNPRPLGRLSQTMSEFFLTPNIFQSFNFIGSRP